MANSSTRSQFMVFVLGGGGVVAILGGAFAIFLAGTLASSNAEFRVHLAELGMLSETIANTSENAAMGNRDAFTTLANARERFDVLLRDARNEASGGTAQDLNLVAGNWERAAPAVKIVLDARDPLQVAGEQAKVVRDTLPQILQRLTDISDVVSRSGGNLRLVHHLGLQSSYGQRIQRDLIALTTGGGDVPGASQRLPGDVAYFGRMMRSLYDGDPEFGIGQQPLSDPNARGFRDAANELYPKLNGALTTLTSMQATLVSVRTAVDTISGVADAMLAGTRNAQTTFGRESAGAQSGTRIAGAVLLVLGVVVLIVLFYMFNLSSDTRRAAELQVQQQERNQEAILRLLDELGSLADGDLTVQATVTEDITGAIADSINFAVEALRSLVSTINETAVQVAAAAQETQATAMHLAEAAEHQAQQITSASAQINDIASSIDQVSRNSAESADVAHRSVEIAAKGADVVRQTIQGMDNIRDQIQETSKRIKRLGESSQEIGSIVELINDIAEQTNILALNAAIQAASAGEAGRGFAVVADEVQRLAERASNATKRIETLVQTIQSDTNEAVSSMEQTTAEVVAGARLAEDAGLALGEIEKVSNDLADLIQNISTAARQQSVAATNITATMSVIQQITTQTSQGANQTAESIGNLAQLAADLRRSVADFKLPAA